jgi:phosphoribosyl-ATP pyrophosphohydrolase
MQPDTLLKCVPQVDVDQVTRETVDQLEIAEAGGRAGRAVLRKIGEETVEVVTP